MKGIIFKWCLEKGGKEKGNLMDFCDFMSVTNADQSSLFLKITMMPLINSVYLAKGI